MRISYSPDRFLIFTLLPTFAAIVSAQISADQCIDPQGFVDCYAQQEAQHTSCVAEPACLQSGAVMDNCIRGCKGGQLTRNLGCWIQSCWNRVYTCDYQMEAMKFIAGTGQTQDTVQIPFYPASDEQNYGPGGCSCNIGNVYGNVTYVDPAATDEGQCIQAAVSGDLAYLNSCRCCLYSKKISNAINVCPDTSFDFVGFNNTIGNFLSLMSQYDTDCSVLTDSSDVCLNTYNIARDGPEFYNPLAFPPGVPGSKPLLNLGGNAYTDFGASVFTLSLPPGYMTVITPVAFTENNAESQTSAANLDGVSLSVATETGLASDLTTGGSSATQTGAADTATGTPATTTPAAAGTSAGTAAASSSTNHAAHVSRGAEAISAAAGAAVAAVVLCLNI